MPKKIYDVLPPHVAHKTERGLKEFMNNGKKTKHKHRQKKGGGFPWKSVIGIFFVLLAVIVVYLFFKLPEANIQIWPKVDLLSFEQIISADKSADSVDLFKNIIPAQYFEEQKIESQDFSATGNGSNEGKAQGTITVYNKYDPPAPITLKTGTHFLSDSGKYFVTLQKIVIPAGKKSGGKVTPGSVQVKVEASEGGESYNIGAAKFSVPKLSGTAYYYSIYAESESQMTGGFSSEVKKVTNEDIEAAKDTLSKKLLSDVESALKTKISSDYLLPDGGLLSEVVDVSTQTKSGTIIDSFTLRGEAKARAVVFKRSDLEKFAKDYIISNMIDSQNMVDKSFKVDYTVDKIDIKAGTADIKSTFSAQTYQSIDKNSLVLSLKNKDATQINDAINSRLPGQISEIKVNFWPFWVKKAPNNQKAIKVNLEFK